MKKEISGKPVSFIKLHDYIIMMTMIKMEAQVTYYTLMYVAQFYILFFSCNTSKLFVTHDVTMNSRREIRGHVTPEECILRKCNGP